MCGLKEIENYELNYKKDFSLKSSENLINNYTLVNPNEIYEFIKNKKGLYEFIIEVSSLVKIYFPNAKIYLEFNRDPEIHSLDSLFAFVYNGPDYNLENEKTFCRFLKQYYILESNFKEFKNYFVIDLIDDDVEYKSI